jgi:GGDEF domain-containing protein
VISIAALALAALAGGLSAARQVPPPPEGAPTTPALTRLLADRVLRRVAGHGFGQPDRPVVVTVSIGIATFPDDRVTDGASLLRLADQNLLKAKADGRNRYRD